MESGGAAERMAAFAAEAPFPVVSPDASKASCSPAFSLAAPPASAIEAAAVFAASSDDELRPEQPVSEKSAAQSIIVRKRER